MRILVDRFLSDDDATLSGVAIDGSFECFGLEDEYRAEKLPGETRIPAGVYRIGLRIVGGFNRRYGLKFPGFHEGMLQVLGVPDFDYILIHIGNTDEDTAGCLLVGQGCNTGEELRVASSTAAYRQLYAKVIDAARADDLTIEYRDND